MCCVWCVVCVVVGDVDRCVGGALIDYPDDIGDGVDDVLGDVADVYNCVVGVGGGMYGIQRYTCVVVGVFVCGSVCVGDVPGSACCITVGYDITGVVCAVVGVYYGGVGCNVVGGVVVLGHCGCW